MTAINKEMVEALSKSLQGEPTAEGLYPVEEMDNHFCSLNELSNTSSLKQIFTTEVDGKKVFVYLKF